MDQTVDQIAAHIDHTRARLGANLEELEQKVDAATDWRQQLRSRPYLVLGGGALAGVLLAAALRPKSRRRVTVGHELQPHVVAARRASVRDQTMDYWDNIVGALVGVASTRLKDYIDDLVPGFGDQYAKAAQRGPIRSNFGA